jgi:N6-adenosine-specific RNA methylase IME4
MSRNHLPTRQTTTKLARAGRVQEIADVGSRAIAGTNDVRELARLERQLADIKKIVGVVTGKRIDINKIAVPMVKAAVKGGRLLKTMDRDKGHYRKKLESHGATQAKPTLQELGFSKSRSSRWQLAGELSDELIEAAQDRIFGLDDEIWGLNQVLRAARQARKDAARDIEINAVFSDDGPFGTVVIDPPWPIENIDRDVRPNQAEFAYQPMIPEEIIAFWQRYMLSRITPDCHLFLWTTNKWLPAAFEILDPIGFRYVLTMVWHKAGGFQPIGLPQYNCEFVVYARRGAPAFVDTKNFLCCFGGERREHSRKPIEFYDLISRVTGGSRIDVFSRVPHEGFAQYGNELHKFSDLVETPT